VGGRTSLWHRQTPFCVPGVSHSPHGQHQKNTGLARLDSQSEDGMRIGGHNWVPTRPSPLKHSIRPSPIWREWGRIGWRRVISHGTSSRPHHEKRKDGDGLCLVIGGIVSFWCRDVLMLCTPRRRGRRLKKCTYVYALPTYLDKVYTYTAQDVWSEWGLRKRLTRTPTT
jgi:hypothetical protein